MTTNSQTRIPITPGVVDSLRYAFDVNLSPDARRVAFEVLDWATGQRKRRSAIWVAETSNGEIWEQKPLSKSGRHDSCPRWSPDGSQLAFTSREAGDESKDKPQLHLIPAQGGEARQVCSMPNGVSDLEWSPDGSRIAFLSLEGAEPLKDPIVVMPERHRRLWTIRPGFDIPEAVTPDGFTVWEYAWSPDSQQIALYYSTGSDDTDWYRGQIGVVSASGGGIRQLTHLTRQAAALSWSPDGKRLAFISGEWSDPCRGGGDIFVLSLADCEVRNLTPNISCSPAWCRWFPDGEHLLYTAWDGLTQQIGMVRESDGTITSLVSDFVMERGWPHLSTTPDLRCFATTHLDQQHPVEIWLGQMSEQGEHSPGEIVWKQLTHLNALPEATFALSPSQRIAYRSADDWLIEALFTPPLTQSGDGPPPLVVDVHGGPSWAWVDDFGDSLTQLFASAGYAVLRPNVRGSWGRGVAFADAVVCDMGGKDFQDILYGVDYLVEQGMVDGQRVAIAGGSYGGFMAAWAVTQTHRFKTAIMIAGVSDFHSFHAQSRINDWDMRFLGGNPLDQPELYRERSAITYAARVQTPTLIIHGEVDNDVPINQAHAFYHALRERHVPVEFVIYPREPHGITEREHLRDFEERILKWLERYL